MSSQEELKSLGARISSIADPKLQRSKFVQLMSRIAQGQVTVEGDQLVDTTATADSEDQGKSKKVINTVNNSPLTHDYSFLFFSFFPFFSLLPKKQKD